MKVRRENEPLKKWEFNFRGHLWKKIPLLPPRWAHNWNRPCMNFQLVRGKQKKSSHICSQSAPDYLPPIWSLPSWPVTSNGFPIFRILYLFRHDFAFVWPYDSFHATVSLVFTPCISVLPIFIFARMTCFTYNALLTLSMQFPSLQPQFNWNVFRCDYV